MYKQPEMFTFGKFGMSCSDDFDKFRIWKIKYALRKLRALEPQNTAWDYFYNLHKVMRDNVVRMVDNSEPLIPTVHCLSNNRYHRRLANQVRHERENAILIKKIQQIFVGEATKSGIDNRLNPLTKCINNRGKSRQKKLLEIALANCVKAKKIKEAKPIISYQRQLKWYAAQCRHRDRLEQYPNFLNGRMCAPFELIAEQRGRDDPRPLCWMDVEVDQVAVGRLYFVLYADVCPMTSENFRSLCAGDRGKTFQCSDMEYMVPDKLFVFGGLSKSIYGEPFPAENFKVLHDRPGILSMFRYEERSMSSQFMITGEPAPFLDGKHVAFGRVIKGMSYLHRLSHSVKVSHWGKPKKRVYISFCGQTSLKYLKRLPEPRFVDDLKEHMEANKQWQLLNPFTKLDEKFKIRKVKHWNESESSKTFEEDNNKKDRPDGPGYDGGDEKGKEVGKRSLTEITSGTSVWSSQWSYKESKMELDVKEDLTIPKMSKAAREAASARAKAAAKAAEEESEFNEEEEYENVENYGSEDYSDKEDK